MGSSSEVVTKTWPTLYKKTSTGADQEWTVMVDGNKIITRYGQTGGKIQETPPTICEGKNIGRSNATTPEEQALLEAQSLWEKKLKKDYVKTLDAARNGEASELVEGGILPMLAKRYDQDAEKIVWPAYGQAKLDGCRCIAVVDGNGKCSLWSRTRKSITSMPHIVKAIEDLKLHNIVLDGELFSLAYKDKFEELVSFIRPVEPKSGCEVVEYHIYDIADTSAPFSVRIARLDTLLKNCGHNLVFVETIKLQDEDEMLLAFERFIKLGYEGLMVRNAAGCYVHKRSYDLQKVKQFTDDDYEITDIVEGKGKLSGHGIFVCTTKAGIRFEAKMLGDLAALREYYEHPKKYIGKMLVVKHQGITNANKVPRFPVALRLIDNL